MKTAKNKNILGLLVAIMAVLAVVHRVTTTPLSQPTPTAPAPLATPTTALPMEKRSSPILSTTESIYAPESPAQTAVPTLPAQKPKSLSSPLAAQNPLPYVLDIDYSAAREALAWVGADLDAELFWSAAINNPDLSPEERKDLIEDLNENGLPDPQHPDAADLPLIMRRIALIEELAPYSMDEANWEAFLEAYKDLINLADLAMGAGQPVK